MSPATCVDLKGSIPQLFFLESKNKRKEPIVSIIKGKMNESDSITLALLKFMFAFSKEILL